VKVAHRVEPWEFPALERMLEDPELRPALELGHFEERVDLSQVAPEWMLFAFDGGMVLTEILYAGSLGVHILALPEARGRRAYRAALDVLEHVTVDLGFRTLRARVRKENCGAQMFVGAIGFRRTAVLDDHVVYRLER